MLLHYVTDIRHRVNKIRPECLKPPAKHEHDNKESPNKDSPSGVKNDSTVDEGRPLTPTGAMPPDLAALIGVNDALDSQKMVTPTGGCKEIGPDFGPEKMERLFRINEDLSSILQDLGQQSKVQ